MMEKVEELKKMPRWTVERRRKKGRRELDIRNSVIDLKVEEKSGALVVDVTAQGGHGLARPSDISELLGLKVLRAIRLELIFASGENRP